MQADPQSFRDTRQDALAEECLRLGLGAVANSYDLRAAEINSLVQRPDYRNYLAMLHDIKLPKPRLVERIAGGMYDVTESVLLG
jgi:hypothetical protein